MYKWLRFHSCFCDVQFCLSTSHKNHKKQTLLAPSSWHWPRASLTDGTLEHLNSVWPLGVDVYRDGNYYNRDVFKFFLAKLVWQHPNRKQLCMYQICRKASVAVQYLEITSPFGSWPGTRENVCSAFNIYLEGNLGAWWSALSLINNDLTLLSPSLKHIIKSSVRGSV